MRFIKDREAYYCNVKFLLLYLAIFGHWLELFLAIPWAAACYRVIYTVHMPLFAFLSGAFLTSARQMKNQARHALTYYLILQGAVTAVCTLAGVEMSLLTPYWHLWYLLSLCQWSLICLGLERLIRLPARPAWVKAAVLFLAVGIGCAVGGLPWVGRTLSLSRTLVFLPYVLAGWLCPKELFAKRRVLGLSALAGFGALYVLSGPAFSVQFLYQADSYGTLGLIQGSALRLLCYLLGALLGIFLLAWIPRRRFPVSRLGADTLGIYLLHAPLVWWLPRIPLVDPQVLALAGPVMSLWILWLLYWLFRWRGQLCAVRSGPFGRREAQCDLPTNL